MEECIAQIDSDLLPELRKLLAGRDFPQVLPSYGILMWFTLEVCEPVVLTAPS